MRKVSMFPMEEFKGRNQFSIKFHLVHRKGDSTCSSLHIVWVWGCRGEGVWGCGGMGCVGVLV